MKFNCQKSELVQAIQIVSKAVASKPQTPILSGIHLHAEGQTLELQATDYEIGILCKISAEVELPGDIVLSGRYLQEVVRSLPGESVDFTYDKEENTVKIRSNAANFTLLSLSAHDFPKIHMLEGNISFPIRNNQLSDLIKKTVFACSTDEARPIFTGCFMDVADSTVTMAATNTHRLSVKKEVLDPFEGAIHVIIPAKILNELMKIIASDVPEDVQVISTYNQISFAFRNVYITSRLIEGQFPDYHRVIPADFNTRVTLDTAEFLSAVDRVSLISRSGEYNIICLEFGNGQVHITSNNPDIGNAEETVPAVVDGPDIRIAFNAKYVTDSLKNMDSKKFYFSLGQPLTPAAMRQEGDETFTYIVTPVRTAR